ncbi:hypothetical protein CRUP_003744 [Coryphaenoides rupestris]|nr:hypothetical protein CRUP_003744 [Coryphaenoides rupestris]
MDSNVTEGTWESLPVKLHDNILDTLRDMKFAYMTPVQSACIPLFMRNKDVAAEAVGALVITPTRELALQISEVMEGFLLKFPQQILLVGGSNPIEDVEKFKEHGANIVIATPGRLEDMFRRKADGLDLSLLVKTLDVLVLDEADRLLDMGFVASSATPSWPSMPRQRRNRPASHDTADPGSLEKLVRAGLRNPVRITVKEKGVAPPPTRRPPPGSCNYYNICRIEEKFNNMVAFLRQHKHEKQLSLIKNVLHPLHPRKMKNKRNKIFAEFRALKGSSSTTAVFPSLRIPSFTDGI